MRIRLKEQERSSHIPISSGDHKGTTQKPQSKKEELTHPREEETTGDPQEERVAKLKGKLSESVLLSLAKSGCHPIVQMARFALGDVVGLGLMTEEELRAQPIFDPDGLLLQKSGRDRALEILPVKVRFDANKELATLVYAKPTGKTGTGEVGAVPVHFYLPDNGRMDDVTIALDKDTKTITVEGQR